MKYNKTDDMKLQDILFFVVIVALVWKRSPKILVLTGLLLLVLAIPLFAAWTFFTAERLTWYAASCFLLAIVFFLWQLKKGR